MAITTASQARQFDRDTVHMMQSVLEEAAGHLPMPMRTSEIKVGMAERILSTAAAGERDRRKLAAAAMHGVPARHAPVATA